MSLLALFGGLTGALSLIKKLLGYIELQVKKYQEAEAKGWIKVTTEDHEIGDESVEDQLKAIAEEVAGWEKETIGPITDRVKSHIVSVVRAEISRQLRHPLAIEAAERIKAESEK